MSVLYISGSGRSGSTLLERVLHASGQTFSAGELHVLWRLPLEKITCSCGQRLTNCRIWPEILGHFPGSLEELAKLEARVSRTGFLRAKGFDIDLVRSDPEVARFLDLQRALFAAVKDVTGKQTLIDSSKAGPRAFLLSCLDEVRFVHLRREPGDVIASWRTRKFDKGLGTEMARLSPGRATVDWMKAEFFARRIARRREMLFMDYHALCAAPRDMVARIGAGSGLDFGGIPWRDAESFLPGAEYHSLNGNPDRFATGPIRVSHRDVDRRLLSVPDRMAARVLGSIATRLFPSP